MTTIITDEETKKLAEEKAEGTVKDNSSEIKREFAHMLVDLNVVPTVIGFAIAVSFAELMKAMSLSILDKYFRTYIQNDLAIRFVTFILVLILCYVFGYLIFYKLIYTEDIAKQTIIRKAIVEKKEEEIKREIDNDPEASHSIRNASKINNNNHNNQVESFSLFR
jgi:hypothetical protein